MSAHPSHVANTCQDTQTSIARNPSKYSHTRRSSPPSQASPPRAPCRYSEPIIPTKPNPPRVRVRVDHSSRVRVRGWNVGRPNF